jgi:type IV pilus assembly protein PilE
MTTRQPAGFTLAEVLIALLIFTMLVTFAVPTWTETVLRGRRAEARATMLDAMAQLERHHLANHSYADTQDGNAVAGAWPLTTDAYRIDTQACPGVALTACVELRAVPIRPDLRCGTFVLRSTGVVLSETKDGVKPAAASCW